jgi:hypothetical protein
MLLRQHSAIVRMLCDIFKQFGETALFVSTVFWAMALL